MGENNVSQPHKTVSQCPAPITLSTACICLSLCALANSSVQDISTALAEQYWLHKRCDPNGSAREKITFQKLWHSGKTQTNKYVLKTLNGCLSSDFFAEALSFYFLQCLFLLSEMKYINIAVPSACRLQALCFSLFVGAIIFLKTLIITVRAIALG